MAAEHFQDHVFRAHPVRQRAREPYAPDFGHIDVERLSLHGQRHLHASRPDGQHADGAGGGGMAVGPEQRFARLSEPLLMQRVTHAISRAAVPDAETLTRAEQEQMIVLILRIFLQKVVVHVLDG